MSKLLISEPPLQVLPSLAMAIGLNEAIFLQQLHYWLVTSPHKKEDYNWVYNSYEKWHSQFPFWSIKTIQRIIWKLEKEEYLISNNFNSLKIDRTKWYTINYSKLETINVEMPDNYKNAQPFSHTVTPIQSYCPNQEVSLTKPIPETTTEITTKNNNIYIVHFEKIWNDYPSKVQKKQALKHYLASVCSEQDIQDIEKALSNYINSQRVKNGYIQNGSTWFNNWRDWIDYKDNGKRCETTEQRDRRMYEEMKAEFGGMIDGNG